MNAKAKGTRNEHRSIRLLESAGYRCTRAAASLGVWDIIGVGSADLVLVQVKSNRWPNSDEIAALQSFPAPANCRKLVHRWRDRQCRPDVREVPYAINAINSAGGDRRQRTPDVRLESGETR